MGLSDKLFNQIKQLSTNITEENYYACHEQGYDILIKIKDLGIEQEQAFKLLLKYHNSLEDGLPKEWIADLLDCICGCCGPHKYIWGNREEQQF
mgnify:FL=1